MEPRCYTFVNNERQGPYTGKQVRDWLKSGHLSPLTLVWTDDHKKWVPAYEVKTLRACIPAAARKAMRHQARAEKGIDAARDTGDRRGGVRRKRRRVVRALLVLVLVVIVCHTAVHRRAGQRVRVTDLASMGWSPSTPPQAITTGLSQSEYAELFGDRIDRNWEAYPDRRAVEAAIAAQQREMARALNEMNPGRAAKIMLPAMQDEYLDLFAQNRQQMPELAKWFTGGKISFLGERPTSETDRGRLAEYTFEHQGMVYYVQWLNIENAWYLYRF